MPHNRWSKKRDKRVGLSAIVLWLEKNPIPVCTGIITTLFLILGGINDLADFIQRWPSDKSLILIIVVGLLYLLLLILSIYIILKPPPIKWLRRLAQFILVLISLSLISIWLYSFFYNNSLENKFVILITKFDGPDPERYRITEILSTNLVEATRGYDDILIIKSNQVIKEDDDSPKARLLGKQSHADLVIWGWYGVTKTDTIITVNVENFRYMEYVPLNKTAEYQLQENAAEMSNFRTQQRLSNQLTAFSIFVSGITRLEVGDLHSGIDRLSTSLSIPEWSDNLVSKAIVYFHRGTAYMEIGDYEAAIEDFNIAEKINPFCLRCLYINRGIAYSLTGNIEKSMEDFVLAGVDEYTMNGILYRRKGDYEKAVREYTKSIENDSLNFDAYVGRAYAYRLLGKYDLSLSDYNAAFELDRENSALLYNRGMLYKEMGNDIQAINDFSASIKINPEYYYVYYNRGDSYHNIEKYQQAISDFNKAIEIDPKIFCAFLGKGWTYLYLGEYSDAIDNFHKMLRIDDKLDSAYYGLGLVKFYEDRYEESIPYFDKAIELGASYSAVYAWRGRSYYNMDDYEKALLDVEKAIEIEGGNYEYYTDRAQIYENLGNTEEAIADYKKSISLQPTSYAYCSLGMLYEQEPIYRDLAISNLEKGIGLNDQFDLDWCKEELNDLIK